jgi:hypothetical protein
MPVHGGTLLYMPVQAVHGLTKQYVEVIQPWATPFDCAVHHMAPRLGYSATWCLNNCLLLFLFSLHCHRKSTATPLEARELLPYAINAFAQACLDL